MTKNIDNKSDTANLKMILLKKLEKLRSEQALPARCDTALSCPFFEMNEVNEKNGGVFGKLREGNKIQKILKCKVITKKQR